MGFGNVGYPDLLGPDPPPHAPPHFFTLFALHANRGSRAAHLCPGRHGLGSCRNIDERMQGSMDALGVVIFCDLRQSQAP